MDPSTFIDPALTKPDRVVLDALLRDIEEFRNVDSNKEQAESPGVAGVNGRTHAAAAAVKPNDATATITKTQDSIDLLDSLNNPEDAHFEPTVFQSWDIASLNLPTLLDQWLLKPYIQWARGAVRKETDVVMVTHLLLYFTTSVPSAAMLFYNFTWLHGVLHLMMQGYYLGTYTLMMHQHIHMRGILAARYSLFDYLFPYLLDPLMGHTWNSYYYHHVKHHHVEGNGPNDLSSTLHYQRDEVYDFLCYFGRFFLLVWFDLPRYFLRRNKIGWAVKAGGWEMLDYLTMYGLARYVNLRATMFVLVLPFLIMRLGLMVGNWGQHAFVDEMEPDSDYRSSITLIDVVSNRFSYNDGYHTSHHLNPTRHWRDHPSAFLAQKNIYAREHALVFRNIDYFMITLRLLRKDYAYLARCLVPIGEQRAMGLEELEAMLRRKTRRFEGEDIRRGFGKGR
ncbi:hypothetical protein AJ80_01207 [Polytolypa hystricis UAMH7299]|uniref:Fatty acid desaturase domain-containing protein n=1 Tax=Polytolypa hystricis (strain UAMH7299) TaxID=1447883 RepID=A0A2B7Z1R6_POLH7|nr:hypothetical protein AJ80_01207 [Polytolypa hystricis UAMH7299]